MLLAVVQCSGVAGYHTPINSGGCSSFGLKHLLSPILVGLLIKPKLVKT